MSLLHSPRTPMFLATICIILSEKYPQLLGNKRILLMTPSTVKKNDLMAVTPSHLAVDLPPDTRFGGYR
jgi:hypothetical protein